MRKWRLWQEEGLSSVEPGVAGRGAGALQHWLPWALPTGKGIHVAEVGTEPRLPSRGGASSLPAADDTDGTICRVGLTPEFPGGLEGTGCRGLWDILVQHPGPSPALSEHKINKPHLSFSRVLVPRGLLSFAGLGLYSTHVFSDNFICAPRDLRLV